MSHKSESEDCTSEFPLSPADFEHYFPWACKQLQVDDPVHVTKVYLDEYVALPTTVWSKKGKSRAKLTQSQAAPIHDQEKENQTATGKDIDSVLEMTTTVIKVSAIYDSANNLVQIKFEENKQLPRMLLKILGLIIHYQNHLKAITVKGRIDQYTVYEMCNFLPSSHITDICLDDCCLKQPNYYMLLEQANLLKYLSLCRCKIDDTTVERIFSQLIYPLPASKTLSILNLSSNMITDKGADFIAIALRSNRQLSYLNLAGNMLTDNGAVTILNSLTEFPATIEEMIAAKVRFITFLKNKSKMIADTIRDLSLEDSGKKSAKRKPIKQPVTKKIKDNFGKPFLGDSKCVCDIDSVLYMEKAVNIVQNTLGNFEDPFSESNTYVRDAVTYCKGNNMLLCLNLSFNSLSYLTLRNLQSVLVYQRLANRLPRGLVSVSVEGNCMPVSCQELRQIENILGVNMASKIRTGSLCKKRSLAKTTPH